MNERDEGSLNPYLMNTNGANKNAANKNLRNIIISGGKPFVIVAPIGKELAAKIMVNNIRP